MLACRGSAGTASVHLLSAIANSANILGALIRGDEGDGGGELEVGFGGVALGVENVERVGSPDFNSKLVGVIVKNGLSGNHLVDASEIHCQNSIDEHVHVIITRERENFSSLVSE
jgi:hypothetical protein